MAGIAKLSAQRVARLVEPGRYVDGGGLYLQVRGPQQRSWIFRYSRGGRHHWMGLGDLSTIPLAEAREAARQCRKLLFEGRDPLTVRNEQRAAIRAAEAKPPKPTLREAAEDYIASHSAGWRSTKTPDQWRASLENHVFKAIGDVSVDQLETHHIVTVLQPIWATVPETASRIRARLEAILDAARTDGHRASTDPNPAKWSGHLSHKLPKRSKVRAVEHYPALDWREIAEFLRELADEHGVAALCLRFLILAGARSGEARGATWREIDMERALWTVPAARMKSGKEHSVPLSPPALAILREVRPLTGGKPDDLVFPGAKAGRPLSDMSITALLRRMGRPVTTHGFRSTFRDWCGEATDCPREVAERALAHGLADKVEKAYARGNLLDKRRLLMDRWGEYCAGALPPEGPIIHLEPEAPNAAQATGGNVVTLRPAGAA